MTIDEALEELWNPINSHRWLGIYAAIGYLSRKKKLKDGLGGYYPIDNRIELL